MAMMTEEGSTKNVNFLTIGVGVLVLRCGHMSHIVKMHYFLENLLLYCQAQIIQSEGKVIMSREGSIKIVNFMTSKAGFLVLLRGHIVNMQYFFFSSCQP